MFFFVLVFSRLLFLHFSGATQRSLSFENGNLAGLLRCKKEKKKRKKEKKRQRKKGEKNFSRLNCEITLEIRSGHL